MPLVNQYAMRTLRECAEIMTARGCKMSVRTAQQAEASGLRKLMADDVLRLMAQELNEESFRRRTKKPARKEA